MYEGNKEWAVNAAVLVVVISRKNLEYDERPSITHQLDAGAAWKNLALEASLRGIVTHGMEDFDYKKARIDLGISDNFDVMAMIAIGKRGPKENLGGSDPFIVCEDADIEKASNGAVKGRFINCGQSCIATKRFFAVKKIANEFIEKFVQKTEKLRVGDPLSDETDIGPLVSSKSAENLKALLKIQYRKVAKF